MKQTLILDKYALLLRFNTKNPDLSCKTFMTLSNIAKLLGVLTFHIRKIFDKVLGKSSIKKDKKSKNFRGLSQSQKEYLLKNETLEKLKGYSLQTRAIICHRKFPEIYVTSQQIAYLYKQNKIKYKSMVSRYNLSGNKLAQIQQKRKFCFQNIIEIAYSDRKIIYIDEIILKAYQIIYKTWTRERQNIPMPKEGISLCTMAAIVCISRNIGLEGYFIKPKSITSIDLRQMIEYLSIQNKDS